MNILILNITINWVYRLYEEYIISFQKFLKKYYNNINISIIYFDSVTFNIDNILSYFNNEIKYDKIFYSGDIGIFSNQIFPFMFNILNESIKNKLYFINIEQLSKESYFKMMKTINNNIQIIDYSEENIVYLNESYESFLFPPYFDKFNFNLNIKYIDILSITNNSHREDFFKNILIDKIFLKKSINNIYGYDRNELFDKTKIYINIHSSNEHLTMEMIRIVNLISRKVIILSQDSINKNLLFLKNYIIICNTHNDFSMTANEILNKYEYYYNKIYENFNYDNYIEYIKENINKLLF